MSERIIKELRENAPRDHALASGDLMREAADEIERLHAECNRWCNRVTSMRDEVERLRAALEKSVKLQNHYAGLLNCWDCGHRKQFKNADAWLARLAALNPVPGRKTG